MRKCSTVSCVWQCPQLGDSFVPILYRWLFKRQCPERRRSITEVAVRSELGVPFCFIDGWNILYCDPLVSAWYWSSHSFMQYCFISVLASVLEIVNFWVTIVSDRAALRAILSASSFPTIPTCPGIQARITSIPFSLIWFKISTIPSTTSWSYLYSNFFMLSSPLRQSLSIK